MAKESMVEDLFDEQGFITDPGLWNRDLALSIAAQVGIEELSELHWDIIDEIRQHHLEHGTLPVLAHLCRERKLEVHCIHRLFGGPIEVWKVAGLPNPGEEARSYMENEEMDAGK